MTLAQMPCALVVMGVSGSGKSTIADKLAERLRLELTRTATNFIPPATSPR